MANNREFCVDVERIENLKGEDDEIKKLYVFKYQNLRGVYFCN